MKKILLYFSVLFIFSCSKGELPDSNYAMVVLTAYASEGGYVRPIKSNKGRLQFTIVRPPGSEITIDALPADGYYFFGWSNGWIPNPLTFKLNSDMEITAVFKQIK